LPSAKKVIANHATVAIALLAEWRRGRGEAGGAFLSRGSFLEQGKLS